MLLQFKILQKVLKDIFFKSWYKLTGKLQFPIEIIPKTSYISLIDLDSLLQKQDVYLLRRSDSNNENTFNELGFLRTELLKPKDIPFLSLNLLGGFYKPEYAHFRISKRGSARWENNEPIFFFEYSNEFEIIEEFCIIYIYANNIHNKSFPYLQPTSSEVNKEVEKFRNAFPNKSPNIIGKDYSFEGLTKIIHDPTKLNYWHVEYNLFDFKGDTIKSKSSTYIQKICQTVLTDILCINATNSIGNVTNIPNYYFIK